MKMYELEYLLVNSIEDYISTIVKDAVKRNRIAREVAPILVRYGYNQSLIDSIYTRNEVDEVRRLRLSKELNKVYDAYRSRIDEFKEDNIEYSLARYDDHFGLALVDFIREDLSTGQAQFANTEENVKTIYEYLITQDFFYDSISNNLKYVYDDIASKGLIEPMVIVDEVISEDISSFSINENEQPTNNSDGGAFKFNIVG